MTRTSPLRLAIATGCLAVSLSWAPSAAAQSDQSVCDPAKTVLLLRTDAPAALREEYRGDVKLCSSLKAVFARLMNRKVSGGRKLEPERPLDEAAAQAELRTAQASPAVTARLNAILANESDPQRRALLTAAVLDDHGHYLARDLYLRRLAKDVNP